MCVCVCVFCCRPVINRKLEDKVCGSGPNLKAIFEDDANVKQLGQGVQVSNSFISSASILSTHHPKTICILLYVYQVSFLIHIGLYSEGLCHGRHLRLQVRAVQEVLCGE